MLRPIMAFLAFLLAIMSSPAYSQNGAVGRGVVRDDRSHSDRITLTMIGIPATARDKVYEAWLVTDNGIEQTSLGNLKAEPDGTVKHTVRRDENLLARYNKLRISLEPQDKKDPKQAGKTVFEGEIPLPVMTQLRFLLVHFSEAPGGTALGSGLRAQASLMLKHVNLASAAAANGDMGKVKENVEAIVNTVEGSKGPHFGDLNNDRSTQNPGDGYGLLNYADEVVNHAGLVSESEGATLQMKLHAGQVQAAAGNVGAWATKIRDDALLALEAGDVDGAKPLLENMAKNGIAALNGMDANNDGLIEPIEGEGGATTAYVYAQNIGVYDVKSVEEPAVNQEPAASPRQSEQGSSESQHDVAPTEQAIVPLILFGLLAGTTIIAAMAFLWVRSKIGITRR